MIKPIPTTVADFFYIKEGVIYNKTNRGPRAKKDQPSGTVNVCGYIIININRTLYLAHRIAWFLYYGEQPPNTIDHIDGDRTNNKKENLRECTQQENMYNQKIPKNNTSGVKGVTWNRDRNKWRAYIYINGKRKHIGYYTCIKEAEQVVRKEREQYHREFSNHGTSQETSVEALTL